MLTEKQHRYNDPTWNRSIIRATSTTKPPSVQLYCDKMAESYVNGSVIYATFSLQFERMFREPIQYGRLAQYKFAERFFTHKIVRSELGIRKLYPTLDKAFQPISSFQLGGSLAHALCSGGAYVSAVHDEWVCKELGEKAAAQLLFDSFHNTIVFESSVAWCDFFCDVAWDYSWLTFSQDTQLCRIIMATDTD